MSGNQVAKVVHDERAVAEGVLIGDKRFHVTKQVNVPTLKHDTGEIVTVRFDGPIVISEHPEEKTVTLEGERKVITEVKKINVARVTELSSMKAFNYVCNAMTADNLRSTYPDNGYVGRSFAIQKLGVVQGKRYKETAVLEIEAVDTETGEVG